MFLSFPERKDGSKTVLVVLVRHRDVDDGQHHEDVGLQHDDQDVEDRPAQRRGRRRTRADQARSRPSSQSSRKMISPAYMLPNSRSECDSGLETYSTKLNSRLSGHSSGLRAERRAEQLVDPAAQALGRDRETIISNQTDSASANVVLTSAVGTMRKPCSWNTWCSTQRHDVHRQEIHRVHQQHPDEHGERGGRDERVAVAWWKMPFTWSSTKSNSSSTKAWRLSGTPEVAPRTTHHRKPERRRTPSRIAAVTSESTLQRPEAAVAETAARRGRSGGAGCTRLR